MRETRSASLELRNHTTRSLRNGAYCFRNLINSRYVARSGGRSFGFQNTGIFSNNAGSPDSVASPTSMPL
jgi:hypothetical protein